MRFLRRRIGKPEPKSLGVPDPDLPEDALREFVYLDETSVYSLNVSRLGPLAKEFTEQQSGQLTAEVGGSVRGGLPGTAQGEVRSSIATTAGNTAAVVRQAVVQSTFRELRTDVLNGLVIGGPFRDGDPPIFASAAALNAAEDRCRGAGWLRTSDDLARGALLEIEVVLEPEDTFKLLTALETLLEFADEFPDLLPSLTADDLRQAHAARALLRRTLVNLVPLFSQAVGWVVVAMDDGNFWVVREALVDRGGPELRSRARPLRVAGVAETHLFWRDLRRVLFSGARYTMMCRVAAPGVRTGWTAAKLQNVLEQIMPEVGRSFASLGTQGLASLREGAASASDDIPELAAALQAYAELWAALHGASLASLDERSYIPGLRSDVSATEIEARTEAFEVLSSLLDQAGEVTTPSEARSDLRRVALTHAGIELDGTAARADSDGFGDTPFSDQPHQEPLLDVEVVAIYW